MGNSKITAVITQTTSTMKVIIAGYSKTGTKSLCRALKHFDYSVDDFPEHIDQRTDHWWRIFAADPDDHIAQSPQIFREMYEHVDVCTDTPAYLFWEQILEAFPDAKVILMERDDEEVWWNSLKKHFVRERKTNIGAWMLHVLPRWYVKFLCYDLWKSQIRHRDMAWAGAVGPLSPYGPNRANKMVAIKRYREHNAYVKSNCPEDKLLIWKPSEGWDRLCKFLGHESPDMPFPNENKGGQIVEDILFKHPRAIRQTNTVIRRFLISVGLISWAVYYCWSHLSIEWV